MFHPYTCGLHGGAIAVAAARIGYDGVRSLLGRALLHWIDYFIYTDALLRWMDAPTLLPLHCPFPYIKIIEITHHYRKLLNL
jgi:hypothetical protein